MYALLPVLDTCLARGAQHHIHVGFPSLFFRLPFATHAGWIHFALRSTARLPCLPPRARFPRARARSAALYYIYAFVITLPQLLYCTTVDLITYVCIYVVPHYTRTCCYLLPVLLFHPC